MKKRIQRWYESDEYLNAFMNLLADLPLEMQCEIAVDMIIKTSEMIDRDYDKVIGEVTDFDPKNHKRWYDKNPNLHLAIENLRDLTQEQRDIIIQEFTDKIVTLEDIDENKEDE